MAWQYEPKNFKRLLRLARENVLTSKQLLLDAIRRAVQVQLAPSPASIVGLFWCSLSHVDVGCRSPSCVLHFKLDEGRRELTWTRAGRSSARRP